MKQSRFTGMLFCATMLLFLTSCGGSGSEEKTSTDSTTAADTATGGTTEPVVNTIITTPQHMMIVKQKVADYAKWKSVYDEHDSMRLASGLHNYVIGRGLQDSNMVLVAVKADDIAKAKEFGKSPGLKKAMQKAGLVGPPSISFITATFQDTAIIASAPRSLTTFTVKDWEVWKKNFEEHEQERIDNGIAVRVVGHDPDQDKKVSLVTALIDTAKAAAFWKSDVLKKRREAGGVTSEPARFVFSIVQRY